MRNESRRYRRWFAIAIALCMAACVKAGAQAAPPSAGSSEQPDGVGVCAAAMTDTSTSPPRHLASPAAKWLLPPDGHAVAQALMAATPDKSKPIPTACGAMRFFVAADGTVKNVTILAEYPKGIGFGDALEKYLAPVVYPREVAGGPYGMNITIMTHRRLMPRPPSP
jgi:hypothetical protein